MNLLKEIFARFYQGIVYFATFFLDFSEPVVIKGENSLSQLGIFLKNHNFNKPLIVTDTTLYSLGMTKTLENSLTSNNINYSLYYEVVANPTINNVEDGLKVFLENNCDCIIAIGGGSTLDCAKMIGARKANPKKSVNDMKGLLHVKGKLPTLFAVPTTAGTGSETTLAAVIVDKINNDKYAINDNHLIPDYAILDPSLLIGLPKSLTASTGMDALTHAIEAYIGHSNTKKSKKNALEAIELIFNNLEKSCEEPSDLIYRNNMQIAAYKAGLAFTRAYVGSVHALAHSLGGKYNIPHGLANAIILPIVLRKYGKSVENKLAKIVDYLKVDGLSNKHEKALYLIEKIEKTNNNIGIKNTFGHLIDNNDLDFLVNHAYKESFPLYPTPRVLSKKELRDIYIQLKEEDKNE